MVFRLVVEAVPGAGKTRLLLEKCQPYSLILAYNNQLAAATREHLQDDDRVLCLTFHGLCARYLAPATDDVQMEQAIRRVEEGRLEIRSDEFLERLTRVLIDEAQDVRPLYAKLLKVLGVQCDLVIVGDRNQLVYDFDEDFPASLDTLLRPENVFPLEDQAAHPWTREIRNDSYRLTPPMARFVNKVFGTRIRGLRGEGTPASAVEVRAPASVFDLYACLKDVFEDVAEEPSILLLTDRKRGNRPLRNLLNAISRAGTRQVRVHGVDPERKRGRESSASSSSSPPKKPAVQCGTYWSAKGLEAPTVIVLLPRAAARNPTYVALTRAYKRLIVVLDPREPHWEVCQAVVDEPELFHVVDAHTRRVIVDAQYSASFETGSNNNNNGGTKRKRWNALDRWTPKRSTLALVASDEVDPQPHEADDDDEEDALWCRLNDDDLVEQDMSEIVVLMCLAQMELLQSGKIRAVENMLHLVRMDPEEAQSALDAGFVGRWVPRNLPDESLLASDLLADAHAAYRRLLVHTQHRADLAEVALAMAAWDGFDHLMRDYRPTSRWVHTPKLQAILDRAMNLLPMTSTAQYDTQLRRNDKICRVHVNLPESHCLHVVWTATSEDVAAATVRAAMHPRGTCDLVQLRHGTTRRIHVRDPEAFVALG